VFPGFYTADSIVLYNTRPCIRCLSRFGYSNEAGAALSQEQCHAAMSYTSMCFKDCSYRISLTPMQKIWMKQVTQTAMTAAMLFGT